MQRLATLLLHQKDANLMEVVVVEDIHRVEQIDGGSVIIFRDRSTVKVTEAASAIQTSIDTLWDEYLDAVTEGTRYYIAGYGTGTAYSLTNSSAALNHGTTDPTITLAQAGTYLIRGNVLLQYNGATFAASRTVTAKFRRTNNTAADLTGGTITAATEVVTLSTGHWLSLELPEVAYTTTNTDDAITIYADVSTVPSAGSLDATYSTIVAQRLW